MNQHSQGPGFGQRGPRTWLLPLIIGLAVGALVFGGRWSMFGGFGPGSYSRHAGPRVEQQAPAAPAQPAGPRGESVPGPGFKRGHGMERDHGHGPRFGFGGLLLPLALMGAGLWLIAGRNRGSGGSTGGHGPDQQAHWTGAESSPTPPQPTPYVDPTPPAQPPYTPPGPTTGPTRML